MSAESLKTSPVHDRHVALGAKMADFSGWQMPIEYAGVKAEHTAVRERVGIFDVSHLGKALVRGPGARDFVNSCFTNDLGRIEPGKAQYTMCCNESGGVVDDLIQYLKSDDEVFLIPNAANNAEVVRMLTEAAPEGIEVINQHTDYGVLAVQGPKSDEVLTALGLSVGNDYMSFAETTWEGKPLIVCRTGYTGERGYELLPAWDQTGALWDALVAAMEPFDGMAAGLGARDTLRTEMGYALHGNELSTEITPVMGRTGWAVGWKKDTFWGKDALAAEREAKNTRISWGLDVTGRGIPRAGCDVKSADGTVIGTVTSGTFSPTLGKGVALALLDRTAAEGDDVVIDVRGRDVTAQVKKPPFIEVGVR
ncbi:glycine cleavage system aminomethyltransferase GcvT [Ornithinimicrobium faecis]|uniref:Aminomethyltransferase n=1 Tax=Ornithinimicrobium faecis TaxID=2934158 RepID=A0ABY4YXZ9_9MICO|nr:glycine cleavage system aminomethyltransferase GcvT [Ornithinimicrobium sp. HY1793]USQ81629.1 glycine cleavage system aminomethyltransferase GcvT [Ornithinimicrobium sp. HY1793]